jgi:ankyrin repeat protein
MLRDVATRLIDVAASGDVERARQLVEHGADPNTRREDGETALAAAARDGHTAVVEMLLAVGADPLLPTPRYLNALVEAGMNGHREAAVLLGRSLRGRADPEWLRGALTQAAASEPAWAHGLMEAGADPNGLPLIMAIQCGELEIVEAMIAGGADVNGPYQDTTPLVRAVESRYPEVVHALIAAGADVNLRAKKGVTPFEAALRPGRHGVNPDDQERIIHMLRDHGARG